MLAPPASSKHFGQSRVIDPIRAPIPAAKIIAFIVPIVLSEVDRILGVRALLLTH